MENYRPATLAEINTFSLLLRLLDSKHIGVMKKIQFTEYKIVYSK